MKSAKKIKQLIKEFNVTTNAKMDQRIRYDVSEIIRKSKHAKPDYSLLSIRQFVAGSRTTKFAAAAVIIIAFSTFIVHLSMESNNGNIKPAEAVQSPAKFTALGTLSFAYRRGGMEAVEEICDKALKKTGARSDGLSMQELLEERNGGNRKRTKL